jgi:hypothetical protein
MLFGVRGWRCTNKAKYIGKAKVEGSIQAGCDSTYFEMFDIWLWLVGYGSNTSLVFRYPKALKPW